MALAACGGSSLTGPPPGTGTLGVVVFYDESGAANRAVAREEGAVLVDLEQAFLAAGDLSCLYTDSLHPNDAGYEVMAETFFDFVPGWQGPRR